MASSQTSHQISIFNNLSIQCRYIFIIHQLTSPFAPELLIQFELSSQVLWAQVSDSFD